MGDYFEKDGVIEFNITDTKDSRCSAALAIHEIVEKIFNIHLGISDRDVDKWDFGYKGEGEPGEDSNCPYYQTHKLATVIEMIVISQLGLTSKQYEDILDKIEVKK